jgi:hypothetical protein
LKPSEPSPKQSGEYEQGFVFPRQGVINEGNWEEFEARGFQALIYDVPDSSLRYWLNLCQRTHGATNVYTGDAYDPAEGRPLHNKPGNGIYASPEGIAVERAKLEWLGTMLRSKIDKDARA